jgi:type I restriction-modification system DNA methylase subunit
MSSQAFLNNSKYCKSKIMETSEGFIKLYPLEKIPLSTQLSAYTGDSWNNIDFRSESEKETNPGNIIIHNQTGKRFELPKRIDNNDIAYMHDPTYMQVEQKIHELGIENDLPDKSTEVNEVYLKANPVFKKAYESILGREVKPSDILNFRDITVYTAFWSLLNFPALRDIEENKNEKKLTPLSEEQIKRTNKDIEEAQRKLDKELEYSPDLQNIERIQELQKYIDKLNNMILHGWDAPQFVKEHEEQKIEQNMETKTQEPSTDTMKVEDGWVEFYDKDYPGKLKQRAKRKFRFDSEDKAWKAYEDMKPNGVITALNTEDFSFAMIVAASDESIKTEIENIYKEIIGKKSIIKEKPEGKPIKNTKRQDNINDQIRKLLAQKGMRRSLYTKADFMLMSQYTGNSKTDEKITDGYLYDFFTPDEIVKVCWQLAYKYGFKPTPSTKILEPSVGIGRFIRYAPSYVSITGYEIDDTSWKICKLLYPKCNIIKDSFESAFFYKTGLKNIDYKAIFEKYDLIIGNPPYLFPYGNDSSIYAPKEKAQYPEIKSWEQYFIMRGADCLNEKGLLIYVVPSSIVDNENTYNDFKETLFRKCNLETMYRLPAKTFQDTDVVTDIIVLSKK